MTQITPEEAQAMLKILQGHDGSTLTPELDHKGRVEVSELFDRLRSHLQDISADQ